MFDSFWRNYSKVGGPMNEESVGKILYIAAKGRERYYKTLEECSKEKGISKQEIDILLFLEAHSSNCACDVVNERGLSKAYVSKAISELQKNGLIIVEPDSNDRRYQHIAIDEKARTIIDYMKAKQKKMIDDLTKNISEEDLAVFLSVTTQMISNLKIKESEKNV